MVLSCQSPCKTSRKEGSILSFSVNKSTQLSFVQPGVHVQPRDITNLVKFAARGVTLEAQGYNMLRIATHSLRASGAMALKLQGVSNSNVMKIGRCTGLTFLTYIHAQIGALNAGLSKQMAAGIHFGNVLGGRH
jgi:hypothetical protein